MSALPSLLYLKHHHTYLLDTLDDGFRGAGDRHGSLSGVGQHVACNLDLSSCGLKVRRICLICSRLYVSELDLKVTPCLLVLYLSHFFDFGASFADEGATLAGWDHEPQSYWGFTGGRTVAHGVDYILRKDQLCEIRAAVGVCGSAEIRTIHVTSFKVVKPGVQLTADGSHGFNPRCLLWLCHSGTLCATLSSET